MYRCNTRISAGLTCLASLALLVSAGCGVTGTQQQIASSTTGGTSAAAAATAPRGPQLGYLWDATQKNLYPVLGVAGAAHYGAPLLAAESNYVAGAVGGITGSAAWALLLDSTGTLDVLTLPSTTPVVVTTRVSLDASLIFAPAGAYALIFSKATNTLLLISGLPAQPQVSALATPAGSTLTGAAVSDRGTVLAGWTSTTGVQAGTLSGGSATVIANLSSWGGAGFVPGTPAAGQEQAVIADAGTGLLTRLAGVGGTAPTATQLASAGKLQSPIAVAVSRDGLWAFAADSAKQQVVRFDLSGSTPAIPIPCACQPARLLGLPGNTVFEVSTDQAGQPAWLLDGHALVPRTFFVPALPAATPVQSATTIASTASSSQAQGGHQE